MAIRTLALGVLLLISMSLTTWVVRGESSKLAVINDIPAPQREVVPPPRPVQQRPFAKGGRPGEVITPPARGERQSDKLKVGDAAPDFTLPSVDGTTKATLSKFKGKKPVVLIFASYT